MPQMHTRNTSGSVATVNLPIARGSIPYVKWVATGWTNPAASLPTEAYVITTSPASGSITQVVVGAIVPTQGANLREGFFLEFPEGIKVGSVEAGVSQVRLLFGPGGSTSPNPMDILVGFDLRTL